MKINCYFIQYLAQCCKHKPSINSTDSYHWWLLDTADGEQDKSPNYRGDASTDEGHQVAAQLIIYCTCTRKIFVAIIIIYYYYYSKTNNIIPFA